MISIKDNVLLLIKFNPELKSDYNRLITTYWSMFNGINHLWEANNSNCASSESITRAFRELVSEGTIRLDKNTISARQRQRKNYKKMYSNSAACE